MGELLSKIRSTKLSGLFERKNIPLIVTLSFTTISILSMSFMVIAFYAH